MSDDYSITTFFINAIVCWEVDFVHYIGEFIAGEGITRGPNVVHTPILYFEELENEQ